MSANFSRRKLDESSTFHKRKLSDDLVPKTVKQNVKVHVHKTQSPFYKNSQNKEFWLKRLVKRFWRQALVAIFIGGIFFIALVAWYSRDLPDPYKIIDRSVPLSTKIYDRTGEILLYEIHGPEKRSLVNINDIPKYAVNATIAVEDKNFYKHSGISLWGILRGQIVPRLQGKRSQGGSTLTQQFVKNAILTNERALSRKIKEWVLSYRLEQKFSKEEILQLYFNEIPYGSSAYGIESAASYYFDKGAKDLTIAESAVLAALPQAPSYYSPYGSNLDALIARQHTVLDLMSEQGYISSEEAENAKKEELKFKKRAENIKAPHFVMYIRQLLGEKYGDTVIEQSGWKIITTIDWPAQEEAEKIVTEQAEKNAESYNAQNAALVALSTENSEILAMVGSKDYFNDEIDGQFNVALAPRQPGSSLKPLVYLAAFNKGFRPDTILFDLNTNFAASGPAYEPKNYNLREHGPVSMRQALAGSLNIPAVKTLYLAGMDNVLEMAAKFGYTSLTDKDRYGLSLVLGGGEVSLLEHANAYAGFAREGVAKDSVAILKIEDSKGKVIEELEENKGRRALEKEPVRSLSGVLSDNGARAFIFGENNYLTLPDRQVAAKTGTTNDYHDAWTMGYTPQIAVGVWVGNNDNTAMSSGADGSQIAAPIWQKMMKFLHKDLPAENFKTTDLSACDRPMLCGQTAAEQIIKIDKMSGLLATEYTPYTQIEERKYMQVHNILHFVDANNPTGDAPTDPSLDSQYALWEAPIKAWAEKENYLTEAPPTEYDNIHLPELRPSINLLEPRNNQVIKENVMRLAVSASAPRSVSRVEYFIDEQKIGASHQSPFSLDYRLSPLLNNGDHTLKAIAFDDLENWQSATVNFKLDLENTERDFNVSWQSPSDGENLFLANLPLDLRLSVLNPQNIQKIDFYYLNPNNQSQWFAFLENPGEEIVQNWGTGLTELGAYKLYLVITDKSSRVFNSQPIIINVRE
jgi:1A family penicillin-binding protein